ncbi:MAG: fibronectin type III domain-containing protein [Deltaproteobacteria bacterium]|nr:fibronectin type III domain-containing protein [Deltaproteobacteria bacterium]
MRLTAITTWALAAVVTAFAFSCGPDARDGAAVDEATASASQALSADSGAGSDVGTGGDAGVFSAERFRAAAACPTCAVLHSARLNLPETKVKAASAKLRAPDGTFRGVTIDDGDHVHDERVLLAAERSAASAKYGKLRPELFQWVAKASASDRAWVWIRVRVALDMARREDVAKPWPAEARAKVASTVAAATGPVEAWIKKNAPEVRFGDGGGPILRAELTAAQVQALASLPQVAELGTDQYPGSRAGEPWGSSSQWGATLRLAQAHALGLGSGATVCVKENTRPDALTASRLQIDLWANPTGATSSHAGWTTGLIRNTDPSPYTSVAPLARILMGNWSTDASSSIDVFCSNNGAPTMSYSHSMSGASAGPLGGTDMQHDWLAKTPPWSLVVAASGDIDWWTGDAYVGNRGFNGLVVGGVMDMNTADRSDDLFDESSAWLNPTTAHNDYELPHVAAPTSATAVGVSSAGTSAGTAMVSGMAALIDGLAGDLVGWPEGKRAVVLATATGRADQGLFTRLDWLDDKIGAGVVDAYQAADLAAMSNSVSSAGNVSATNGRFGSSLWFASDVTNGYVNHTWKVPVTQNGRLRVALAWDASANCSGTGGTCQGDVIDADLDLHIYRTTAAGYEISGTEVCSSATYDSTWEACDISVAAGETYLIAIGMWSSNALSTYYGLAWYQYRQPSGELCASPTDCATGICTAGRCGCTSDTQCADRFCSGSGQCTTRQSFGSPCTRAAECNTGFCADGVCCNDACAGTCNSCLGTYTGSVDGVCGPTRDDVDPRSQCALAACVGGVRTEAWVCNGSGGCRSDGTTSCGGFACGTTSTCATTCSADAACMPGFWCTGVPAGCNAVWPAPSLTWEQDSTTSAKLSWSAAHAATTSYRIYKDDVQVGTTSGTTRTWVAGGLTADVQYSFRVEAENGAGSVSTTGPRTFVSTAAVPTLTPPPTSAFDPTIATDTFAAAKFLYAEPGAVQTDVVSDQITAERVAILRGVVRSGALGRSCSSDAECGSGKCGTGIDAPSGVCCAAASCSGVAGAKVTVVGHAAFGKTITRADGSYDLAVNGGGRLTVRIERAGTVPVQRTVDVPWNGYVLVPEVVLTPLDAKVTRVPLGSSKWELVESSISTDSDGVRHVMLAFPPGSSAAIDDEPSLPTALNVRATELTVGGSGLAAMPGELPPNVAYTYAVSIRADEAGSRRVSLSAPVVLYVDNFLKNPDGTRVLAAGKPTPIGYYDPTKALWVPEDSGVVIDIIGREADGNAKVDVTGDGVPDTGSPLTALGITSSELATLGARYPSASSFAPVSLMRQRITHFSDYDINLGFEPESGAAAAKIALRAGDVDNPCRQNGSIIECENQVLGERLPIAGTELTLEYWSSRAEGRSSNRVATVDLSDPKPANLRRIIVQWSIGGRVWHDVLPASATKATFTAWDGLDVYGRKLTGRQKLTIGVGYVFGITYRLTGRFGYSGGTTLITSVRSGGRPSPGKATMAVGPSLGLPAEYSDEVTLWTKETTSLGSAGVAGEELGGWNIGALHTYDPYSRILFKGSGERVSVDSVNDLWWSHFAGRWPGSEADGAPALEASTGSQIGGVAVARDGSVYFVAQGYWAGLNGRIGKIARQPGGTWTSSTVGTFGFASLPPRSLRIGPDDQLYFIADNKVQRLSTTGGSPQVVAGGGGGGDGTEARIALLERPTDIAFGADGSLLILDFPPHPNHSFVVRRVPPARVGKDFGDMVIETFAKLPEGDSPSSLAVGADGQVYVAGFKVFRIPPTGGGQIKCYEKSCDIASEVCCDGADPVTGDLGMCRSKDAACGGGWTTGHSRALETIAGTGSWGITGDGGPASSAAVSAQALAIAPDGSLVLKESYPYRNRLSVIDQGGIIRPIGLTRWGDQYNREGPAWDASFSGAGNFAVGPGGDLFVVNFGPAIWRMAPRSRPASVTGFTVIDPNGAFAHEFDASGRHTKAIDVATNKPVWTFARDSKNRVNKITDAHGRDTLIFRAGDSPDGTTTVPPKRVLIVAPAPYRQTTELVLNDDGTLNSIANPQSEVWSVTWKPPQTQGLLKTLTDPRFNVHTFEWNGDGRLQKDSQPAGLGHVSLTQVSDAPTARQVEVENALGLKTSYRVERDVSPTVHERRVVTLPDATQVETTSAVETDLSRVTTSVWPDGRAVKITGKPDPILGRASPLADQTTTIPLGTGALARTVKQSATVPEPAPGVAPTYASMIERTDEIVVSGTGGAVPTVASKWSRKFTRNTDGRFTIDLTSPEGRRLTVGLDALGRVERLRFPTDTSLNETSYTYDLGRIASVSHGTRTTRWTYRTDDGFVDTIVNALGYTTKFDEFDLVGRVKRVTLPAPAGTASQVSLEYDGSGNVWKLKPPGRLDHVFVNDAMNRPQSYTAPTVPSLTDFETKWTFALDGSLKTVKEPGDSPTAPGIQFENDTLGRLWKVKEAGIETTYNYETGPAKRLESLDRTGSPSIKFLFDNARPKGLEWKSGTTVLGSIEVEHDNHFRVWKETINASGLSRAVEFGYDRDNLLVNAGATLSAPTLTVSRHVGSGQLLGITVTNGAATVSHNRTYNSYGETKTSTTTRAGTTLLSFDYEPTDSAVSYPRDAVGRMVRLTETESVGGSAVTRKYRYGYDEAGRLTDVYREGSLVEHYEYGANGTRASVTKGATTKSATYDGQDRLLTFGTATYSWTAAGRLASRADGTTMTYAYDGGGALLTVMGTPAGTILYTVDPLGRRVGRTVGTATRRWFYDGALRIVGELDPAGTTLTQYVYATRVNVPEYALRGSEVYRVMTDHVGSLRQVVRVSDGGIMQRMEYDAFGVVETDYIASGWDPLPFGFAGGLYDRDTKLVRFGARDYDPETGRWTAKDPIGFGGGDTNLYGYVGNDPVNWTDPTGLDPYGGDAVFESRLLADGYMSPGDASAMSQGYGVGAAWGMAGYAGAVVIGETLVTSMTMRAMAAEAASSAPICGAGAGAGTALTDVSRWGRPGLQPGDWGMMGRASPWNYFWSGKWQPGLGNQYASYRSGETFSVPKDAVRWPAGFGIDGWIKGVLGQRKYEPFEF